MSRDPTAALLALSLWFQLHLPSPKADRGTGKGRTRNQCYRRSAHRGLQGGGTAKGMATVMLHSLNVYSEQLLA